MAKSKVSFKLRGHEKFILREGWLNKGLQVVSNNIGDNGYSRIFFEKNASDEFGVGNNMVKSIRYWLRAFNLIDETPGKGARVSDFGKLVLQYDPYLEDINTIWLLHSNIAQNANYSTIWYLFFNKCDIEEFTKSEIEVILNRELQKYIGSNQYSENSLKSDIDILLNMYCKERIEDYDPEDKNICPLSFLEIVKKTKRGYYKKQPNISTLNEWVILYDLKNLFKGENKSLSIEKISNGDSGLCKIYNINRINVNNYLDKLEHMNFIRINRTAGLDVVYIIKDIDALKIVEEYYKTHR